MTDIVKSLADYYPLDDLLAQNDIEPYVIVKHLVDEGLINLSDYIYLDGEFIENEDG